MRVAVIGAGVVGTTTAYELDADGHEVTVFERRGSVAAEASFGNAGVVAPGYVAPWTAAGMPAKVLRQLLQRHAAVRVRSGLDAATLRWLWRWFHACGNRTFQANRLRMQRLALFSRERLHRLTRDLKLDYERSDGLLVLLRSAREAADTRAGMDSLSALGIRHEWLDAARCRVVEPHLDPATELHGGLYLPDDEVGNCRQFTALLRAEAQRSGVRFCFHTEAQRLLPGQRPQVVHRQLTVDAPAVDEGAGTRMTREGPDTEPLPAGSVTEAFDAVVVCAGVASAGLLQPHGLRLPLIAVGGYSITAPLRRHDGHFDQGPRSAVMDERYKVAISRLGNRVRVAGGAEIGGRAGLLDPRALATLYKVLHDWYPASAWLTQAQPWRGARPMLPDGPPVIGRSGIAGVFLNLGHGSSGWALACGSARLAADAVAMRPSPIDTDGLGLERLLRAR